MGGGGVGGGASFDTTVSSLGQLTTRHYRVSGRLQHPFYFLLLSDHNHRCVCTA